MESITFPLTGIGLVVVPKSTGIACGLTISNKLIYEIIIQMYSKYRKQYDKDQQILVSFVKLYRKKVQDNVNDKIDYESLCNFFTTFWMKLKMNFFYEHE